MASFNVACVVVLMCTVVVSTPISEAAISCDQLQSGLDPCIPYLQGGGPAPSGPCCAGVQLLNSVSTTPDIQAACNCLKAAAGTIQGLNLDNTAALPGKCGVSIPYTISPSIDCSKIGA